MKFKNGMAIFVPSLSSPRNKQLAMRYYPMQTLVTDCVRGITNLRPIITSDYPEMSYDEIIHILDMLRDKLVSVLSFFTKQDDLYYGMTYGEDLDIKENLLSGELVPKVLIGLEECIMEQDFSPEFTLCLIKELHSQFQEVRMKYEQYPEEDTYDNTGED